jgi:histidine triad (HIT) family protein
VIPRRHIPSLDDLQDADQQMMGALILRTVQIARSQKLPSDGYRVVANAGPAAGQTVFHIHLHLLGGRNFGWPPG